MMLKRIIAAAAAISVCCMSSGCGESENSSESSAAAAYDPYTEYIQPVEKALEALKSHDGELFTRSYFSPELLEYEAEVWSDMSVDEYYETFDSYLEALDAYYSEKYGSDYTIEYEESNVKIAVEEDEFEEIEEIYTEETDGDIEFDFTDGYDLVGQLVISGSLGEDTSDLYIFVLYREEDGWKCYLNDFFVSEFYDEDETDTDTETESE